MNHATTQGFVYTPLSDASNELRLLRILPTEKPGSDSWDEISALLETINFESTLVYDALSYTWGNPAKTRTITVNGQPLGIGENLYWALHHLRNFEDDTDHQRNKYIWIDALCINQDDEREKSSQVQMMRDIYSAAQQVIVWLGPPDAKGRLGMASLNHLVNIFLRHPETPVQGNTRGTAPCDAWRKSLRMWLSVAGPGAFPAAITHVEHLFQLSWWSRVWIVQEVAVARSAWVLYGSQCVSLDHFRLAHEAIRCFSLIPDRTMPPGWTMHINRLSSCFSKASAILSFDWKGEQNTFLRTLNALFVTGSSQATDPRDRIYALLGLRSEYRAMVGKVDYSSTWQSVYTEAARAILQAGHLQLLGFCHNAPKRRQEGLPSWAPDWRSTIPIAPGQVFGSPSIYAAAKSKTLLPSLRFSPHGTEVTLQGVIIAEVTRLGRRWSLEPTKEGQDVSVTRPALVAWHKDIDELASALQVPELERPKMVMKTTCADRLGQEIGFRRMGDDKTAYDAFLSDIRQPDVDWEPDARVLSQSWAYNISVVQNGPTRRPFGGSIGQLGVGPETMDEGDLICVLLGLDVPYALRRLTNGKYILLGEAYLHGYMDGEALAGSPNVEEFTIC